MRQDLALESSSRKLDWHSFLIVNVFCASELCMRLVRSNKCCGLLSFGQRRYVWINLLK
jgi:hypothetical protein